MKLIRWPSEENKREWCRDNGELRLLVVECGAEAPLCTDMREDWIRAPYAREDLINRIAMIRARTLGHCRPEVDTRGVVRRGSRCVAVSPTEAELLALLADNFGCVVPRESLRQQLAGGNHRSSQNALDLHIMRLRRRIAALRLVIRTAWGRGYVLTTEYSETTENELAG